MCIRDRFYAADKKEELVNDFIIPMLKSGAKYEGTYLLGTSIARPVIAKALVEIAQQEGCLLYTSTIYIGSNIYS